ncbi:Alpha-amylase [invertebrate metagenome]|uniref:Alpha-amylase n=1 Tax=invertebrate metagenome TaxID=1711999 RepID=A0A484HCI0_9ZZZZ
MTEGPRIYNLFPLLVGTVQQWEGHLSRIACMGFNWVYVNPFHYPGFSGSLYAVKDYYRLHPLMEDGEHNLDTLIRRFCKRAAEYGLSVIMDLVINHTAKDSVLVEQYPQWFRRETDGLLYSPRAIDPADSRKVTIWGDLAELDYQTPSTQAALVSYFGNLIGYFIDCGIQGFRCDAAYQVPAEAWYKLIRFARFKEKGTIFLAESLGCKLEQIQALRSSGFDYLFNSAKWWDCREPWLLEQYEAFRHIAPSIAFPESHDTDRLVTDLSRQDIIDPSVVERAYRLHYLRAATFSTGVMMPLGYEFGFSHRLHVVTTRQEDWEYPRFDLSAWITAVNHLKAMTHVLNVEGPQYLVRTGSLTVVGLIRRIHGDHSWVVTYMNTDLFQPHDIQIINLDNAAHEVTPDRIGMTLHVGDTLVLAPGEARMFVSE